MYSTTFLASCFRSIRFGINEAHGRGIAVQLNYLLDQGGFLVGPTEHFQVNGDLIKTGVTALTRDIMTIQADGDYARAKALGERMGVIRPTVQKALDRLADDPPVDIEPRFVTADELRAGSPSGDPKRLSRRSHQAVSESSRPRGHEGRRRSRRDPAPRCARAKGPSC